MIIYDYTRLVITTLHVCHENESFSCAVNTETWLCFKVTVDTFRGVFRRITLMRVACAITIEKYISLQSYKM